MEEEIPVLQIYGQYSYHHEAVLVGNRLGLLLLRQAVEDALDQGKGKRNVVPSDGEGYEVVVELLEKPFQDEAWRKVKPEYGFMLKYEDPIPPSDERKSFGPMPSMTIHEGKGSGLGPAIASLFEDMLPDSHIIHKTRGGNIWQAFKLLFRKEKK